MPQRSSRSARVRRPGVFSPRTYLERLPWFSPRAAARLDCPLWAITWTARSSAPRFTVGTLCHPRIMSSPHRRQSDPWAAPRPSRTRTRNWSALVSAFRDCPVQDDADAARAPVRRRPGGDLTAYEGRKRGFGPQSGPASAVAVHHRGGRRVHRHGPETAPVRLPRGPRPGDG